MPQHLPWKVLLTQVYEPLHKVRGQLDKDKLCSLVHLVVVEDPEL